MQVAPVALATLQTLPQPPQLVMVVTAVSHPSVLAPFCRQSAKPFLHWYTHLPAMQLAELALVKLQTLPQPPQFWVVVMAVSQPFTSGAPIWQSANPALQLA